jgi:Fur family ferric uptake transcriptional regulator
MACSDRLARDLRSKGFRVTPQRAVILEVIAHRGGHQSAKDVYRAARKRLPGLNPVTVYRTLESLQRAGVLDLFSVAGEVDRFALRERGNPHAHLVCSRCGTVVEVTLAIAEGLVRTVSREHGFALETSHLTLTGLCRNCRLSGTASRPPGGG